jgi:D-amino-acid dehydrogenase
MPNSTSPTDVLIIGGGVIGVCTAYYLAEAGRSVTLIEQGDIAAGSSYGNAGLIVPSHITPLAAPGALSSGLRWMLDPESPFYIKPRLDWDLMRWLWRFIWACQPGPYQRAIPVLRDLGRLSSALHAQLAALIGPETGYGQRGLLMVYKTPRGLHEGHAEARLLNQHQYPVDVLDAAGLRALEPTIRPDVVGGLFYRDDAHFTPVEFVRGLARLAQARGACLFQRTEVLGFETQGRRLATVRTTRGDFQAEQIVLAAGAWSPNVAHELKLNIPIQAAKGYSVTVKRPTQAPTIPLLLGESRVAVTPMVSSSGPTLRFAGTLELAGLDFSVNQRRVKAIQRAVKDYLEPMDETETVEIWRGLRPCTPDGLPMLGRAPAFENLTLAAGHAMLGMSLGPATGKLVKQLLCNETPEMDVRVLRPERF